jgi:NitT/TauT family transport system substrate-binding protein
MRRSEAIGAVALSPLVAAVVRRASAQSAPQKIRVAGGFSEDLTPLYYAIKTGMFRSAGLDVELVSANSGAAAAAAVVTGAYEMAKGNLLSACTAHLRGIPIVLVAPENLYTTGNPSSLLQIAADSPYRTGADLNGKICGVPGLDGSAALSVCAWVDKNGGNWRTIKFVEIPNAALETALIGHRVDMVEMQSPQLDASLAAGTSKTLGDSLGAIAPTFMYIAYIARADWAIQHAADVRRFNQVLAEATNYVNTHLAQTAPLVAELTKIDPASTRHMHRSLNATVLDPALVQPFIDATAKYGYIARSFPAREIFWAETS